MLDWPRKLVPFPEGEDETDKSQTDGAITATGHSAVQFPEGTHETDMSQTDCAITVQGNLAVHQTWWISFIIPRAFAYFRRVASLLILTIGYVGMCANAHICP